jgi:DNA-binding transcriptional LysR family regulator
VLDIVGATSAASLTRREADIALRLPRPDDAALKTRKLGDLRHGLYGAREYLDRVVEKDWAFLAYGEELQDSSQQRWRETIASGRPVAMLTNDLVSLLTATRAGISVAALPHALVEGEQDLVCVSEEKEATRQLWLVYHTDIGRSGRVRVVLDYLVTISKVLR